MSKKESLSSKVEKLEEKAQKESVTFMKDYSSYYFTTDKRGVKYKAYHYFKLLKIFTNQMNNESFISSKRAFYLLLFGPVMTAAGFAMVNPMSVFKNVSIGGCFLGSIGTFVFILKEDMFNLAREETTLGLEIREIYK
ncbi:unnamed protein product [Moneuplotes crassus]|uniref:Uncharacterized protein n=1 Tax=Euplotes crassus TaxID=5936 RepID=A0AAD1Y0Q9_EUPCR|nr:unnamed protein product [Moneuplotes crassus]